jgi:hypothetical protein
MEDWILAAPWILGIAGTFIGSFLNVCIHRMPSHRSIVWPGSACPACGAPIKAWQNVPILSWIALRGRCASCRAPIAIRYPLIEALTGATWVIAWLRFGPTWDLAAALVFLSMLIVLFFTDLDERILPDLVTAAGNRGRARLRLRPGRHLAHRRRRMGHRRSRRSASRRRRAACAAGSFWLVGRLWKLVRPGLESGHGTRRRQDDGDGRRVPGADADPADGLPRIDARHARLRGGSACSRACSVPSRPVTVRAA